MDMKTQLHDIAWQYFRSVQSLWSMILLDKTIILHDLGNTVLGQAMFFTNHRKTAARRSLRGDLASTCASPEMQVAASHLMRPFSSHRNGDDFGMIKWHWVYNVHDKKGKLLKEMVIMFFFLYLCFCQNCSWYFCGTLLWGDPLRKDGERHFPKGCPFPV